MAEPRRRPPGIARLRWAFSAMVGHLVGRVYLIAVAFSIGLAALGAAFGLLPDLQAEGWAHNQRLTWLVVFGLGAVLCLGAGIYLWWRRNRILNDRGTAYIIEEHNPNWTPEEKAGFLAAARAEFRSVYTVPGPGELGADWAWPLDARTDEWDRRVDELVRAFWTLHHNDDTATPNAVYLWTYWPVALAFGLRALTGHRGLRLHVRQRPSYGRVGTVAPAGFNQTGHTFLDPVDPTAAAGAVTEQQHRIVLNPQGTDQTGHPQRLTVLLLRTSNQPYGTLPVTPQPDPVSLAVVDGAGLGLTAGRELTVHEWRYQPRTGATIAWADYPAVAAAAADWICRRAAAEPGTTLLLGATLPQEVGIGLGLHATTRPDWPPVMWPLVYDPRQQPLVVPHLNLGTAGSR